MKKFLITICAVGVLFSGCGSDKPAEKPAPVQQATPAPSADMKVEDTTPPSTQAPPVAPAKVLNLGMTLDQFKSKFAMLAENFEVKWLNVSSLTRENGTVQDTFEGKFSETLVIQGAIDKSSGLMKEVWLLSQPQTNGDFLDMIISYGLIISILNPELSQDERGNLMKELKIMDANKIKELVQGNAEAVRGNVRYTVILMPNGIFQLIAAAKDI